MFRFTGCYTGFLFWLTVGLITVMVISDSLLARSPKDKKSETDEPLVMGTGKHKYEWIRDWAKLPEGMQLGNLHGGVQADASGNIYVSTESENAIMVFDQNGKFLRGFGKEWKTEKPGNGVHGLLLRRENGKDYLYLAHLDRHEFAKITVTGETVWVKGWPEQSGLYKNQEQFKPTGIAVAPNGDVYVTDGYGENYVHHYSAKGDYINSFGGKAVAKDNPEDGKFNTPHAILIDTRGKEPLVLLTDRANHRLQWFTLAGKHVRTLKGDNDLLRLPATLHQRGSDIVVGDLAGRVTILDKNNQLVTHLGDNIDPKKRATNRITQEQWLDGQFISPHGITWDKQGNLYVEEWLTTGRLVKLKRVK